VLNPDKEWATWQDWIGREPGGRTIYAEVVEMLLFRKMWRGFAVVYEKAPEEARRNGTFLMYLRFAHARSLGAAVRRQADVREDVVSLGRLIDRVWRYPTVLTRERFRSLQGEDDAGMADEWFNDLAGPGEFINPEIPARDRESLRTETAEVRKWVNTAVAHFGRREAGPPPLLEIHRCVDVVFDLFHKYANLIGGYAAERDVVMTPWPTVFRVPWIPDDDHFAEVMREIEERTRPPR
jgi:hypothetical protein